jgi:hypothetical protein
MGEDRQRDGFFAPLFPFFLSVTESQILLASPTTKEELMATSWAVHSEDHQDSLTGLRLVIPKGATKDRKTKTSLPKVLSTTKEELMATS